MPDDPADHWYDKGHVLLVVEGELVTELKGGRTFTLTQGTSCPAADCVEPHWSRTKKGAKLYITD